MAPVYVRNSQVSAYTEDANKKEKIAKVAQTTTVACLDTEPLLIEWFFMLDCPPRLPGITFSMSILTLIPVSVVLPMPVNYRAGAETVQEQTERQVPSAQAL